jgi:hypothetical protein
MAAGQAAHAGAQVTLIERMPRPGRKLQITGKGRCNLTNTCPLPDFLARFHEGGGRFLKPALLAFPPARLMTFFAELGVGLAEERGGRVFPTGGQAGEVVEALTAWAAKSGLSLLVGSRCMGISRMPSGPFRLEVHSPAGASGKGPRISTLESDAVIIATGGLSYPGTGSTGDGFAWAKALGHSITPLRPALVALEDRAGLGKTLAGLTLKHVKAIVEVDGRSIADEFGEAEFTDRGLGGPIILSLSRTVVDQLRAGKETTVMFDLKPALDDATLDARLRRECEQGKRPLSTILATLLPRRLIDVCLTETGLDPMLPGPKCPAEARRKLHRWLKSWRFVIAAPGPWEEAIITAGGIDRREIRAKSLESRLLPGVFFAGEILDLDADTGGFNLQAAFSTGWLAGRCAAGATVSEKSDPKDDS